MHDCCSTCVAWEPPTIGCKDSRIYAGTCHLFPTEVRKFGHQWCLQHKKHSPAKEILQTDLKMLQISAAARRVCTNLGIETVEDIVLVGRGGIRSGTNQRLHWQTIRELVVALQKMGVEW